MFSHKRDIYTSPQDSRNVTEEGGERSASWRKDGVLLNAAFWEQHEQCTLELTAAVSTCEGAHKVRPSNICLGGRGAQETPPFPVDLEAMQLMVAEVRR